MHVWFPKIIPIKSLLPICSFPQNVFNLTYKTIRQLFLFAALPDENKFTLNF